MVVILPQSQDSIVSSSREKKNYLYKVTPSVRFTSAENTSIKLCEVNWRRCGRDRDNDLHHDHCKALSTECGRFLTIHVTGGMKCCAEEVGPASYLHARSHDIEIAKSPAHRCCSRAAGSPATVSAVRMETKCTRGCPRVM